MCARFQFAPPEDWVEEFGLTDAPAVAPRYNIAPTQDVLAVRRRSTGDRQARLFRWGLVPHWAEDPRWEPPDQRARESGHAAGLPRPVPAAALPRPAQGFYEWKKFGRARKRG